MIYLHTGQPGAGKTLYTLWHVKQEADKSNRTVYYNGIADLMIPGWVHLDEPEKWYELPAGSIIVLDEAQRVFRPRSNGSQVPPHVERLETHRHQGVDIYVITQHPALIDNNVRRLVGTHRHIQRAFGTKYATVHSWNQVKDQCDKSRADSVKSQFPYPKEVFTWYKSAELHTHKASIPGRVFALALIPILIGGCVWAFYRWVDAKKGPQQVTQSRGAEPIAGLAKPAIAAAPVLSWVDSRQPRVPELVHTAPIYDDVTKPQQAPYPAACVATKTRCKCYTQQGTKLGVRDALCREIAAEGYFVDWQPQPVASARAESQSRAAPVEAKQERAQDFTVVPAPPRWRDGSNGLTYGKG